jgi:hypothetical protein
MACLTAYLPAGQGSQGKEHPVRDALIDTFIY